MKFRIEDLPARVRRAIEPDCVLPAVGRKPSKMRNVKVKVDGIKFDSKKEAARYKELKRMEAAGAIRNLTLQDRFTLEGPNGVLKSDSGRKLKYVADFQYWDLETGKFVIEDVKAPPSRTQVYKLKKAIMRSMGFDIKEL